MTTPHPDGVTLNDYADGALPPGARAEIDAHLASCRECRSAVDGLQEIRAAARRLRPLNPGPQSWRRIERALRKGGAPRQTSWWPWLAAAAVLLLATLSGVKIADTRRRAEPAQAASVDTASAQSVEAELMQAEQHYQKAITGLEQIANAEKGSLDPQTASTLEKNLEVIDQAIGESRAALRAQPASEPAQASLLEGFKTKIALLQDTIALINEMRKGPGSDNAGAARIVSGLKPQKGS